MKANNEKNMNVVNRTIQHIREVIRENRKVEERVTKLKYYGYDVQERYLNKYNGVGKIEIKPSCSEYLITIGQGKHHKFNQVYAVVITKKQYIIKVRIFKKQANISLNGDVLPLEERKFLGEAYLKSYDSSLAEPHFNVREEAKIFDNLNDAKYVQRGLNDMNYIECDIEATIEEVK